MRLNRASLRRARIDLPADASDVLRFAAEELGDYLQKLTGAKLDRATAAALPSHSLALGQADAVDPPREIDSFVIAPAAAGAFIAGCDDRSVLTAVYRLLESLGCRWSFHGRARETVPQLPEEGVELHQQRESPAYALRAYASDLHTWHYLQADQLGSRLRQDAGLVDWMGKTGANRLFFIRHPFDTQLAIPELLPELQRRGIAPECGGHVIPLLLPRELFQTHPEYFPHQEGGRTDLGNMCTSNDDGLRVVTRNAVHYAREHPEVRALHVWGADLWTGGWCQCSACRPFSVQDQSLRVCNAVAEQLRNEGIDLPVCYLAYHDTLEPALTRRPDPGVIAEFAPRERCYAHAIADADCATNRRYREALDRHVEIFDGRVRVFEYYGDSILFCGCAVPLGEVIRADLDAYRGAGVREISFLQFGAHSLWAHPLNFLVFAARTWGRSADGEIEAYCRQMGDASLARRYFLDLEKAMRAAVTHGDIRRPSSSRAAFLLPRLEEALPRLQAWQDRLSKLRDGGQGDGMAQAALVEYTCTLLQGVALQLRQPEEKTQALDCYARALEGLRHVDERHLGVWGTVDLPVLHSFHDAAVAAG